MANEPQVGELPAPDPWAADRDDVQQLRELLPRNAPSVRRAMSALLRAVAIPDDRREG